MRERKTMAASIRPDTLISSDGPPARASIRRDTVSRCGLSGGAGGAGPGPEPLRPAQWP